MGVSFVVIMMNARLLWVHDALLAGLHFQRGGGGVSDVETQRRRLSIAHGRMERKKRRTARQEQADFERK